MSKRNPLWSPKADQTDLECLKAWCHWKHKETPPIDVDEQSFVKAIEDVIAQAGMLKPLREQLADARKELATMTAQRDQAVAELAALRAVAEAADLAQDFLSANVGALRRGAGDSAEPILQRLNAALDQLRKDHK